MREYDVNEPVESREEEIQPVEMKMRMEELPMRGYDREPELKELVDYKPKKQELLREFEIRIKFLSVGCLVSVGCKDIPFRDIKEAMDYINKYVENPYEEGMKWREIFESEG